MVYCFDEIFMFSSDIILHEGGHKDDRQRRSTNGFLFFSLIFYLSIFLLLVILKLRTTLSTFGSGNIEISFLENLTLIIKLLLSKLHPSPESPFYLSVHKKSIPDPSFCTSPTILSSLYVNLNYNIILKDNL